MSFIRVSEPRSPRPVHEALTIFVWQDRPAAAERKLVAASASSEAVEIYYALENNCHYLGSSCTVSSHVWFNRSRQYEVEGLALD
jgi:hypothetical protein